MARASSLVIDTLCNQAKKSDIAVACFYYDFSAQREQTITNMIGAILKQLVGKGGISEDIREAFQEGKKEVGGRGLRLADLMGMLEDSHCFATKSLHMYRCPRRIPTGETSRASRVTARYCSGVS